MTVIVITIIITALMIVIIIKIITKTLIIIMTVNTSFICQNQLELAINIIFLIVHSAKKILFDSVFECVDVFCCF